MTPNQTAWCCGPGSRPARSTRTMGWAVAGKSRSGGGSPPTNGCAGSSQGASRGPTTPGRTRCTWRRGLRPGREYWYQFEAGSHVSLVGRTRTAPARGSAVSSLTFASISCQAYDHGYFTSFPHIVVDDPDFVMHLGDYIYEYAITPNGGLRNQPVPEVVQPRPQTLRQWRARHALAKSDPDQQALHQQIPMVLTWDDHEYLNDYAGTAPTAAGGGRSPSRSAAYRADWEHQPLRSVARFKQGEIRLYRRLAFGDLLQVDMIDVASSARCRRADGGRRRRARRVNRRSPCSAPLRSSGCTPGSAPPVRPGTPSATTR